MTEWAGKMRAKNGCPPREEDVKNLLAIHDVWGLPEFHLAAQSMAKRTASNTLPRLPEPSKGGGEDLADVEEGEEQQEEPDGAPANNQEVS